MTVFPTLRAANAARQKEWDKAGGIALAYRANEMAGEIGEALEQAVGVILMAAAGGRASNIAKKIERERLGIRGSRATVGELAAELADVVTCADLIAMGEGIDLDAAIAAKFNATSEKVGLATRLAPPAIAGIENISAGDLTERAVQAGARALCRIELNLPLDGPDEDLGDVWKLDTERARACLAAAAGELDDAGPRRKRWEAALQSTPLIETLTPTTEAWSACVTIQDR